MPGMPGMPEAPGLRTVMRLALPALGALAAEPLYVLGDTAIVGHVSTEALAGLALGGLLLAEILGFVTVLEYGATRSMSACRRRGSRSGLDSSPPWSSRRSPIRRSACSQAAPRLPTSRG